MAEFRRRIPGLNSDQVMHAMGIDDAYHVERVLVRGRNGVTELVTIEGAGPFVRKKMPLEDVNRSVWATLAGGDCPRLPQVAATYEMPDCFVAVYDYVPGETLEDVVARAGALDAEVTLQVARDVCEALSALHARGVMHLDVSPRNVILAADGAHLVDFGNARLFAGDSSLSREASRPKGTWGFAAPEQFFSRAGVRSDVFAVGRLMGYMLTGMMPDEDAIGEFDSALRDEFRVPASLRHLVERATDFEPSARYRDIGELADALVAMDGRDGTVSDAARAPDLTFEGCHDVVRSSAVRGSVAGESATGRSGRRSFSAIGIATIVLACTATLMGLVIAYRALVQDRPNNTLSDGQVLVEGNSADSALATGDLDDSSLDVPEVGNLDLAFESLKIVESGWTADKNGYIDYAVTLENSSEDLIIEYPEVVITGRDAEGSVVFSSSQVMGIIFPNSTMTFSCTAGDGTAPEVVEFSLARPQDYQVSVGVGEPTQYKVHDVASRRNSYGMLTVSGEVEKVSQGDEPLSGGDVWLSVVLRDGEGDIISGANSFARSPSVGERMPFSMQIYDCPQYEALEVVPLDH